MNFKPATYRATPIRVVLPQPKFKEVFFYDPTGKTVGIYASRAKGSAAEVKLATDIAYEAAAQTGTVVSPAELKATSTSVRIRLAGRDASAIKEAAEIVSKLYEDHGYHVVKRPSSERKFRAAKAGSAAKAPKGKKTRKSSPRGVARFHTQFEKQMAAQAKRGGRKSKAFATPFADAIGGWSMGGKAATAKKPRKTAKKSARGLSPAQIHARAVREMEAAAKRGGRKSKAFSTPFADAIGGWSMKPAKTKKPRSPAQIAAAKKNLRPRNAFKAAPASLQAEMARVANGGFFNWN